MTISDNSPGKIRELLGRSQALLAPCQTVPARVPAGVEVAVEDDAATRAGRGAIREGERVPLATARAVLTRGGRMHGAIAPTGPGCRGRE
jgi:hypothetical protein